MDVSIRWALLILENNQLGIQGRLIELIKERATGVVIVVEFPRIILKGPQNKVNRIADTVDCIVSNKYRRL